MICSSCWVWSYWYLAFVFSLQRFSNSLDHVCNNWIFLRFAFNLQIVHLKLKNKLHSFVVKRGLPGPFWKDSNVLWFVSVNVGCSQRVNRLVPSLSAQPPSLDRCISARGVFLNNTCREVESSLVSGFVYMVVRRLCQYHPSGHLWATVSSTHCCSHSVLELCILLLKLLKDFLCHVHRPLFTSLLV